MSTKDASKKGIIPTIVSRFSPKDQADKPAKERKKRPTTMLSSRSFYRSTRASGELLKGSKGIKERELVDTSEWIESMEHVRDKNKIKKKKKYKRKNGTNVPPLQPVQLRHAPSIAGIHFINLFIY